MAYRISFDPLWKTLIDKKMSKTELTTKTQLSKATIAKIGMNIPGSESSLSAVESNLSAQ